jgi:hypothetical protein
LIALVISLALLIPILALILLGEKWGDLSESPVLPQYEIYMFMSLINIVYMVVVVVLLNKKEVEPTKKWYEPLIS